MIDMIEVMKDIQDLYLSDETPWIVGYSGGKDSTTVLQLIYYALSELPKEKLTKELHVVSSNTLVENPAIDANVSNQLKCISYAGKTELFQHNPNLFHVARVTPCPQDRFWVKLIGLGYPSPNRWFRWCTERLKINPTSDYAKDIIEKHGQVIIVLGTRKAESSNRSMSMSRYDRGTRLRDHTLPNAFVYAPIADLSNNEVWAYLLQVPSPWNGSNKNLLKLYRNACSGGECPFVIETGTQSCGKSRFGCWVCTVVDKDRSMEHFVNNGYTWMNVLLEFRNWLYDIRQQTEQYVPSYLEGIAKFGPFLLQTRRKILSKLLGTQGQLEISLIDDTELTMVRELVEQESEGQLPDGIKKLVYQLANGKTFALITDYDISKTSTTRKRVGPRLLRNAVLVSNEPVSPEYSRSTRIMYYQEKEA